LCLLRHWSRAWKRSKKTHTRETDVLCGTQRPTTSTTK
jgi:hypothetical protein